MHLRMRICICPLDEIGASLAAMKIAKPLLLVSTPLGMASGLFEAYRMVGGLAILMFAMMGLMAVAMTGVVLTIRREREKPWTQSGS